MADQPIDVDSLINNFTVDDLIDNYQPSPASPPPISGPDGPLPQPTVTQQGAEQPTLLHKLATGLSAQDAPEAAALGVAKAGIELKDFAVGEPQAADKSGIRQFIEGEAERLKTNDRGILNSFVMNSAQFSAGWLGIGKFTKLWGAYGSAGKVAGLVAQSALTPFTVIDPHEAHFSDTVQKHFPDWAQNAVNDFLATKPEDTEAKSRLKNSLENMFLDGALTAAWVAAAQSIRLFKLGDIKGANAAKEESDELFKKVAARDHREQFFDHDEYLAQQRAKADAEDTRLAQVDDMGGARKDFLRGTLHGEGVDTILPGEGSNTFRSGVDDTGHSGLQDRAGGLSENAGGARGATEQLPGRGPEGGVDASVHLGQSADALRDVGSNPAGAGGGRGRGADTGVGAEHPVSSDGRGRGDGLNPPSSQGQDFDTAKLLKGLQADTDALVTYGSRDNAVANGHKFKSGPDFFPWQKFHTTEESQAWMGAAVEEGSQAILKARGGNAKGVLTDKAVNRMVAQRAAIWGEQPEVIRGALAKAGKDAPKLAADMETSFLIANKAYQDTYELALRINSKNFEGFGSEAEALAALQNRLATATTFYAQGQAILTNAARTMRRARSEFRFTEADLANIRNSDPKSLADLITKTNGDPKLLAKAGRMSLLNKIINVDAGLTAANMLWGWKTQVVNFGVNGAMLLWRPSETLLGSLAKSGWGALRGDEQMVAQALASRQRSLREITYINSTLMDGMKAAKEAFMTGDSILVPHGQEHLNVGSVGSGNLRDILGNWHSMDSVDGAVANTIKAATAGLALMKGDLRVMGAADEVFKQIRYRSIVQAKASVEADSMGLTGAQAREFVSKKLDDAFDASGVGTDAEALNEAQASVFQNAYVSGDDTTFGSSAASAGNFIAQQPALRIFVSPFFKTPVNLFRYGTKLTPGLNLLQKEYRNALSGAKGEFEQVRAIGQMGMGVILASVTAGLWAQGLITGAGPENYAQNRQWQSQGNRAYALTWHNDKGEKQFFELNRWDPIGMPITLLADAMNLYHNSALSDGDKASALQIAYLPLLHIAQNKTYLKSITDFLTAVSDGSTAQGKFEAWGRRWVQGQIPFSALLNDVKGDPYLREARSAMDAIMARTPGLADKLPPRRDFFGDPIMAPQGFTSSEINKSELTRNLDEIQAITGQYLSPPAAKSMNTGGVDLRDFLMENGRSAYDRYQELSGHPPGVPSLKDALSDLVHTEQFKSLTHGWGEGTTGGAIMDVMKRYREAAFQLLLQESPSLKAAVNQKKIDTWYANVVGAKDPRLVAGQARLDAINNRLLRPYGLNLPAVAIPPQ